MDENYDYVYKIIIIGDSGVGKSSLMIRYVKSHFEDNYKSTIGIEFYIKMLNINEDVVRVQIWDTAGQDRYRSVTNIYYRNADGIFIVYDVTNIESFDNVIKWLDESKKYVLKEDPVIVLIGNKLDKDPIRSVSFEKAKSFCDNNGLEYFETSACDNLNVNEVFLKIINKIHQKNKKESLNKTNKVKINDSVIKSNMSNQKQFLIPQSIKKENKCC